MPRSAHLILMLMLFAITQLGPAHELAAQEATPSIAPRGAATPVPLPTTPAGDQLAWLVDQLNAGATAFTPEDVEAHFAPSFLEEVPAADLAPDLSGLGTEIGPVVPTELDRGTTEFVAGAIVQARDGEPWLLVVGVEGAPPHRIAALNIGPIVAAPEDASPETPRFEDATAGVFPSPQPCGPGTSEGCYSNYVRLADLNGDTDLDVVFGNGGGYFTTGGEAGLQPLVIYENDGAGHFTDASTEAVGGFLGRLRQVAIGDIEGDGDLDLYAPGSWGERDALFVNDGTGQFTDEAAAGLPANLASRAGATRFGDVDGDGDLDLVVTDWGEEPPTSSGTAHLYLNDSMGHFTQADDRLPLADDPPLGTAPVDVDFVDVDGDFDLDLILNNRDNRNLLWLNDGQGTFTDATEAQLPAKPSAMSYDVEPCDVDGDDDLDLWVDNAGPEAAEQLLINDGTGRFTDESATRISGNPPGDDNELNCADVDQDGDMDAVVAALQGNDRVLINDGTGQFTTSMAAFPTFFDPSLSMELGDLDGDAILDAVTAQGESVPWVNRFYRGVASAPPDRVAPAVRGTPSQEAAPTGIIVRFAVADGTNSDGGPRLAPGGAYVEWMDGGQATRAPASWMGGDLFQAIVPVSTEGAAAGQTIGIVDQAGNETRVPLAEMVTTPAVGEGSTMAGTPEGRAPVATPAS